MSAILETKEPSFWGQPEIPLRNCRCHGSWVGSCSCYKQWMAHHKELRAIEIRSLAMGDPDRIVGSMVRVHQ